MAKVTVLAILAAAALLLSPWIALAEGPPYCSFAGKAELDGANVDDGTTITAIIAGDEYSTTTPTGYGASTYVITIQSSEGTYYADGTPVGFKINGHAAQQTGIFQAGKNIRLDLTASTGSTPATTPAPAPLPSPEPGSPTNVWLIVILVLACIVEALLVGEVAFIVLSDWNR